MNSLLVLFAIFWTYCLQVKVIAIDSFAFHFRHNWDDMSNRTRVMNGLAQQFVKMASANNIAVCQNFLYNFLTCFAVTVRFLVIFYATGMMDIKSF